MAKSIFLNLQHYPKIESMPSKSTAMNARVSDSNGEIAKLFFHKRCLQPGSSIMGSVDFSSASRICCQFLVSLISKGISDLKTGIFFCHHVPKIMKSWHIQLWVKPSQMLTAPKHSNKCVKKMPRKKMKRTLQNFGYNYDSKHFELQEFLFSESSVYKMIT